MRTRQVGIAVVLFAAAVSLTGCVAYPVEPGPYYGAPYYGPPAPVYVQPAPIWGSVTISNGWGWRRGWRRW